MQIICPNCGSKSPIEAGSLVTQTRIVCARCAVEFAAELSDEQRTAPAAIAGERGIELFCAAEAVVPASHAQPAPVTEVAAPPAEAAPAGEIASEVVAADKAAPADEVAAPEAVVESAHEALPAAEASPAEIEVEPVAAAPDAQDSGAAGDVYEVLSLPEEAVLSNEPAKRESAVKVDHLAGVDHSNVLEDVFAAWTQSRESKPVSDAPATELIAAADDYVTLPLSPAYEASVRKEHQPSAESTECPSAEVLDASTNGSAPGASTDESARPVEADAEEAARSADDEHELIPAAFADVSVPPQVAAARSFDGYGVGVRLLRVSPLWLLVSGLSFISFVVFCNWFFIPSDLAQAEAVRPASRRNEATNRPAADATSAAGLAPETRADTRNSDTSRTEPPAGGEVVNASLKVAEPTPATPAPTVPAATPAPTPAQKTERPRTEPAAAQPAPDGKFTVQVGSYNAPGEAEARAAGLRSAGQPVRVVEVEIPRRGKWYRVYVGGFARRTDAEAHGKSLRERGLAESYIATESQ